MANIDAIKILGNLLNSGALSRGSGSNVLNSVIGALTGGGGTAQGGGLGSLVSNMLGGGRAAPGAGGGTAQGGGLGSLVSNMLGGGRATPGAGGMGAGDPAPGSAGLGELLGGLLGGGGSSGGGLGDLLGMAMSRVAGSTGGGQFQANMFSDPGFASEAQRQQATAEATLLIRAMINAAKADGQVDQTEQQHILEKLGDVTAEEAEFVRREMAEPLDVAAFVRSIPRGMEQQVYAISLLAIDLDTNQEAKYLHELAQGCGISPEACNAMHEQFGAPKIYR